MWALTHIEEIRIAQMCRVKVYQNFSKMHYFILVYQIFIIQLPKENATAQKIAHQQFYFLLLYIKVINIIMYHFV